MASGRALSRALGLLWPLLAGVFAPACTQSLWDEPVIYRALDYRIEGPRVLALSVDPPVFTSGAEVAVDALVVGPGLQESRRATLNVCGLDPARPITLLDMECFSDLEQVQTVAAGDLPLAWTPPDLAYDCEVTGASGGCSATVPFILESRLGEAAVVAGFNAEVSASMAGRWTRCLPWGPAPWASPSRRTEGASSSWRLLWRPSVPRPPSAGTWTTGSSWTRGAPRD